MTEFRHGTKVKISMKISCHVMQIKRAKTWITLIIRSNIFTHSKINRLPKYVSGKINVALSSCQKFNQKVFEIIEKRYKQCFLWSLDFQLSLVCLKKEITFLNRRTIPPSVNVF